MTSDPDPGGQCHEPVDCDDNKNDSVDEQAHRSDELACKLAYECGWRLCGDALQTLESQRTRAFTLLSVTIVTTGVVLSAFLRGGGGG